MELKLFSITNYLKLSIADNAKINPEIYKKIQEENEKLAPLMKPKIHELLRKAKNPDNPPIIIGTGNSWNNPCYLYNIAIIDKCPKCGRRVEEKTENEYEVKKRFDDRYNTIENVKDYNESGICTGFR